MSIPEQFRLVWTPFLKMRNNRMHQAVGLVCPTLLGSGGDFVLQAGGRKYAARTLDLLRYAGEINDQNEPIRYLWLIPRPARPIRLRATWRTPFGGAYHDTLTLQPAAPRHVHIVFKTHLDIGYTARIAEVMRLYQTTLLERTLENLDRTADRKPGRRFVWTMPTWLLERCLDSAEVAAEHIQRLEKHIRAGSVSWSLSPFTTHSEFFGLEEMCRSLYAARRLAERFGRPVPTAARMTDVPAHTASLAMAFAAAGGTFFQIGTNPESMPPDVPPLFWWKLPDGKQILCHYRGTYGTPLLPPQDWPWEVWPAVQITNDNVGPQTLDVIRRIDWIEQHFDFPLCRTGRLEDFSAAVIRRHARALPVVEKEVTDWWIHGIASQSRPTATAREDKERLPSAETLGTLAGWAAGQPPADEFRDSVRDGFNQLALYTEHTWGDHASDPRLALPRGSFYTSHAFASDQHPPPVDRWVASWEDKAGFAAEARAATDRASRQAVTAFTSHIGGNGSETGIAVFNPLNWARGGLVRMPDADLPAGDLEVTDPTTGGAVLYERGNGIITFMSPPVPACGYLVLQVSRSGTARRAAHGLHADWDARRLTLHTSDQTLQFHTAGGLARWHDRARSSQWCSGEAEFPMGTYLYEMPGGERLRQFARRVHSNSYAETEGYFHRREYEAMPQFGPVGGGKAIVRPEITPLYARVAVEAECPVRKPPHRRSGDARRYRTVFTIYHGHRDLHVRLELIGKRPTYAAESGYAFFPFAGEDPCTIVDRVAHQLVPADELAGRVNAAHMAVGRGIRIEGNHAGMNFYPLHTPLVSFGQPGAFAFDSNAKYKTGVLYATLFNNCWGTNFAQWQSGDFSFDFVLRPTGNDAWDGGLAQGGAEVHRPLVAAVVNGPRGEPSRSLLAIEPPCVQLVTLKPADFDAGAAIRLWNTDPEPVKARLRLPEVRRADALWRCDLLERTTKRLSVNREGEATLPLAPYEIATLLLKPKSPTAERVSEAAGYAG